MSALDRYAVIGQPVAHSRSPQIHRLFAAQTGQALQYQAIEVAPAQLADWIAAFFAEGGAGLNLTVPHKEAVIPLLAALSARARSAGAVNTLRLLDGQLLGDNTDGVGLVRDLTQNLGLELSGRRILLLGAGGAARGVLAPLLECRPETVVIANRTAPRAEALALAFAVRGPVRAAALSGLTERFDLIINATAAGLNAQVAAVSRQVLGDSCICYDMIYGPAAAHFLQWAHAHGAAQAHDGLGMLVEQAAEAFFLWRGVRPDTTAVLTALRASAPPAAGR